MEPTIIIADSRRMIQSYCNDCDVLRRASYGYSSIERFMERGTINMLTHVVGVIDLTENCNHLWEEQYSNFKETKYVCSKCGATQIIPRLLEKHTHEPVQDNEAS